MQEEQIARPRHPRFGHYELEEILETFRRRGFIVSGGIRPKTATVEGSADRVVAQIRELLESGVPAERILVVGASMGAGIALAASAKLGAPGVRFALLGACLAENVRILRADGAGGPGGRILSIREASDDLTEPCAGWEEDSGRSPAIVAREIVIRTGLGHGFLYRPLPEWVDPVIAWAEAPAAPPEREAP